jgi:uncharacterized protein
MANLPTFAPPDELEIARTFWDAVARQELMLPRCSVCGRWQWYPEVSGTDCAGGTLVWQPVAHTGTLYSYTRVHRSFLPGGKNDVPYLVGLIDLDDVHGPRLVAPLLDELRIGERIRARFIPQDTRTLLAFGPID